MASSRLLELMSTPLPCKSDQIRLSYRPSLREVYKIYDIINEELFRGRLIRPEIKLGRIHKAWGWCHGHCYPTRTGSLCTIRLSDKWYCIQWLVITLAHEMAHQYQWDILGPKRSKEGKDHLMSHGPTFFQHREKFDKHSIPLKTALRTRKWFKYQNVYRC